MKKQKQKLAIHKVWNQHRFTSLLFLFAVFVFALGNILYQSVTDRVSENEALAAVGDLYIYNCESQGIVGDHPNIAIPLCARVVKEGTYPAEAKDVDVNWAITSRETSSSAVATLASTVSKTNQSGLASNSFTSDTTGTYFVKASLVSGEFVTIKVLVTGQFGEYTIGQYGLGSGDNQIGTVSAPLAGNFVVQVSGVPGSTGQVGSLTVTWRVASYPAGATGYSISPHTVVDEYGVSRNKLTLGNLPGTYTVEASKDGVWGSPVTFSAIAYSSGSTTTINPVYSGDPVVQGLTVTNRTATKATISWKEVFRGDADSNHRVEFADFGALGNKYGAKRGDAKYTEPADCNSNGTVDFADYGLVGSHYNTTITGYKINSPVGTYSTFFSYLTSIGSASDWKIWEAEVSVASTAGTISVFPEGAGFSGSNFGASVAVPAFVAPDDFSISLAPANNGNNQTGLVSTDLANDFVVIVKNNGTPVAGKVVNWAMTQGPSATTGQSMNPASSTTTSTGLASSRFHLGSIKGNYIVTARLADEITKTVQFTVTAAEFVVIKTAGDGQEGGIGSRLTNQLQVIVRIGNQPVSGQSVHWTAFNTPLSNNAYAGQCFLSDLDDVSCSQTLVTTTDSSGRTSVYFKVGTVAGNYQVGVSPISQSVAKENLLFSNLKAVSSGPVISIESGNNQGPTKSNKRPSTGVTDSGDANNLGYLPVPLKAKVTIDGVAQAGRQIRWSVLQCPEGKNSSSCGGIIGNNATYAFKEGTRMAQWGWYTNTDVSGIATNNFWVGRPGTYYVGAMFDPINPEYNSDGTPVNNYPENVSAGAVSFKITVTDSSLVYKATVNTKQFDLLTLGGYNPETQKLKSITSLIGVGSINPVNGQTIKAVLKLSKSLGSATSSDGVEINLRYSGTASSSSAQFVVDSAIGQTFDSAINSALQSRSANLPSLTFGDLRYMSLVITLSSPTVDSGSPTLGNITLNYDADNLIGQGVTLTLNPTSSTDKHPGDTIEYTATMTESDSAFDGNVQLHLPVGATYSGISFYNIVNDQISATPIVGTNIGSQQSLTGTASGGGAKSVSVKFAVRIADTYTGTTPITFMVVGGVTGANNQALSDTNSVTATINTGAVIPTTGNIKITVDFPEDTRTYDNLVAVYVSQLPVATATPLLDRVIGTVGADGVVTDIAPVVLDDDTEYFVWIKPKFYLASSQLVTSSVNSTSNTIELIASFTNLKVGDLSGNPDGAEFTDTEHTLATFHDNQINTADLGVIADVYGQTLTDSNADVDSNGEINVKDVVIVAGNFLSSFINPISNQTCGMGMGAYLFHCPTPTS